MAHKSVEQLGREIEAFQEDIRKLQRELSEMSKFVPEVGKKLQEKGQRLKTVIGDLKSEAGQKAYAACEAVRHGSAEAVDKGRMKIEQKPIASVLIAFAAGLLVSRLFGRIHS